MEEYNRRVRLRLLLIALILLGLLGLGLSALRSGRSLVRLTSPSARVLFVGNSFTYFNGGVDTMLRDLDPSVDAQKVAFGGFTLKAHWENGEALHTLRGSTWNYVVLQEQSQVPVLDKASFIAYATRFSAEARTVGAEPILFMTWEYPESTANGVTTQRLANAYYAAGSQARARVAPAGLAFADALRQRPDMALTSADGHPTVVGSYLATCVLYATIFGKSPVGLTYGPGGLSAEDKAFLQQVAAPAAGYSP